MTFFSFGIIEVLKHLIQLALFINIIFLIDEMC